MKKLIVIGLVMLAGCQTFAWKDPASAGQVAKIKNHQLCRSDLDCAEGDRCGFVDVDTYAVCLTDKAEWTGTPSHPTF